VASSIVLNKNLVMALDFLPTDITLDNLPADLMGLCIFVEGELKEFPIPKLIPLLIDNVDKACADFHFARITNLEIDDGCNEYEGYYSISWTYDDEDGYNYRCTFHINIEIKFDELLVKMVKLKKLCIRYTPQIVEIKQFPETLTTLLNYSNTIVLNLPDSIRFYHSDNHTDSITIPKLPEQLNRIQLTGKCLGNSFYSLPSLITNITIDVSYFKFDIEMWPMNLKYLKIYVNDTIEEDVSSFGQLPYGLEEFTFRANNYEYPFDMPPTLKKFSFDTYYKYPYPECFDNLPDSIEIATVNYASFTNITKLPKKCKTFYYLDCPHKIFRTFIKNKEFKGVCMLKRYK